MNKKITILEILPALIIISMCLFTGFTVNEDIDIMEKLLKDRTNIMQNCIYGEINCSEGEEQLGKIEMYPLLAEDIKSLRQWDFTQLDVVNNMKIINSNRIKKVFDYTTYKVSIIWDMSGLSDKYILTEDYYVVIKKVGKNNYLSSFEPI